MPVAYVDIDQKAALAYNKFFPHVPRFGDVRQLEQAPGPFVLAIQSADVCFVGAPCEDHTSIITSRDPTSQRSLLIYDALVQVQRLNTAVGVFEVVPDFLKLMGGADYCGFHHTGVDFAHSCPRQNGPARAWGIPNTGEMVLGCAPT